MQGERGVAGNIGQSGGKGEKVWQNYKIYRCYYCSLKKNHLLEKDLSASIKFVDVFFVQGLPGSVGEKGEKGDSAGDVVGAKVSQMMVAVLPFVHH